MKFTLMLLVLALAVAAVLGDKHDQKEDLAHAKAHPNEKHSKNDGHGHKRSVRSPLALSAGPYAYAPAYAPLAHAPAYAPYAYAHAPVPAHAYFG